jgi:phage terminase large subunit-like protein
VLQHRARLERLKAKYVWDEEAASKAVRFIEGNLRHWKAPFTGQRFRLSPWQAEDIIKPLFGLKHTDGRRVFRRAYIQIPRKNGKSALAAAILLLVLCTDPGHGHELYTAATKRDQAKIVFNDCVQFVKASPKLRARLQTFVGSINYGERSSTLVPLSADYNNLDGLNVSAAVVDELHAHPSAALYDVITTATGARDSPLVVAITTAGKDAEGVCYREYEYATDLLDGTVEDDGYFAFIAEADPGLSWDDPAAYRQANPNIGVSIREDYLASELERARALPTYRKTYERYHLNRWVQGVESAWLPVEAWRACRDEFSLESLRGLPCWGGLDLSSTTDLTALSLISPRGDHLRLVTVYWVPERTILRRSEEDRVPYDVWRDQGWVRTTPGSVIDYDRVVQDIRKLREVVDLRAVAYDNWNAVPVYTKLQEDGLQMVEFVQGLKSFHPPTYDFEKRVLEGSLLHDGNPCTAWQAGHVVVSRDDSGKMRPVKRYGSDRKRIDGIVASIMALDCYTRLGDAKKDAPPDPEALAAFRSILGV